MRRATTAVVRADAGGATRFSASVRSTGDFAHLPRTRHAICRLLNTPEGTSMASQRPGIRGMSDKVWHLIFARGVLPRRCMQKLNHKRRSCSLIRSQVQNLGE
jgi:hypothetical protein